MRTSRGIKMKPLEKWPEFYPNINKSTLITTLLTLRLPKASLQRSSAEGTRIRGSPPTSLWHVVSYSEIIQRTDENIIFKPLFYRLLFFCFVLLKPMNLHCSSTPVSHTWLFLTRSRRIYTLHALRPCNLIRHR